MTDGRAQVLRARPGPLHVAQAACGEVLTGGASVGSVPLCGLLAHICCTQLLQPHGTKTNTHRCSIQPAYIYTRSVSLVHTCADDNLDTCNTEAVSGTWVIHGNEIKA